MGFKVIIVGGGLAGSLLANGLINNGVEVKLYERDSPNSKREGYQIRLGNAALKGFRTCLQDKVTEEILAKLGQTIGIVKEAPAIYTSDYRLLIDLSTIPNYAKSASINRVLLRDILIQPIIDGGHAAFGKGFSQYEIFHNESGVEQVRVYFSDGTSDTCDVLIGADGSASKVNKQVGLNNLVEITSHWSFLHKGKLPANRIGELPRQLQKGPVMTFSKGTSMYYALYMPAKSTRSDLNEKASLDYDEEAASFFWGLNIPKGDISYDQIADIPDRRQLCLDHIKDWAPEYKTMLSADKDDKDASDLYAAKLRASDKPATNWRSMGQLRDSNGTRSHGNPRVWLIGDAIHAMQPTRGMGGNQALLDCSEALSELLRLNATIEAGQTLSSQELSEACSRYEAKMLERSFTWVQKSGGSSMLSLNLDGILGYIIYAAGSVIVPILTLYYTWFGTTEEM